MFGGAAATWLLSARAQSKVPNIGFLGVGKPSDQTEWTAAFAQRMREHGWIEDRTVAIEYRFAEERERYVEIASEFVRLKVDVIVTAGAGAFAVKQATSIIPIVFTQVPDPVGSGLVTSVARPGGNLTGVSSMTSDLARKSVELLREVVPTLRHLAILTNVGNPNALLEGIEIERAARTIGIEAVIFKIRRADDIAPVFEALKSGSEATYVVTDPLTNASRAHINSSALGARMPTMYNGREIVAKTGGLMCYGPDIPDLYRGAADIADKILRGTKPGDIPVEQPTKFDLIVNLKTAKTIGVTIPPTLLALANEVIE
jgi:putative ABC transport system substrate-binding protein